jgi:hypothetical protein
MWSQELTGNNNTRQETPAEGARKIMTKRESDCSQRGRPRLSRDRVRSNRVVTFVTQAELERLEQMALHDDRSLSAVVHRIITHHFGEAAN